MVPSTPIGRCRRRAQPPYRREAWRHGTAPFGCGPSSAFDQSLGNGWGSTSDPDPAAPSPKSVTVKLPRAVNISSVAIDPGNTCGDGGSASTKGWKLETSVDGTTFTVAASGTFGPADRHRLNSVPVTAAGVTFVCFSMLTPQLPAGAGCPGPFSGCLFVDMSELEVYGTPSA